MWPGQPATRTPAPTTAVGSPPIMVVGATKDPATPYVWAQRLAGELQHGVLVTWQGENHVAYYYSACVRAIDAGLLRGRHTAGAGDGMPRLNGHRLRSWTSPKPRHH